MNGKNFEVRFEVKGNQVCLWVEQEGESPNPKGLDHTRIHQPMPVSGTASFNLNYLTILETVLGFEKEFGIANRSSELNVFLSNLEASGQQSIPGIQGSKPDLHLA